MSVSDILSDLEVIFERNRAKVCDDITLTAEGCRIAADQLESIANIKKRVFSAVGQNTESIEQDLSVLKAEDATMQDFRKTEYGQTLFNGLEDQIVAQISHQTTDSQVKKHIEAILNWENGCSSVGKLDEIKKTSCYLCETMYVCEYNIDLFLEVHEPICTPCAIVADKILEFTALLWYSHDFIDIKIRIEDINRVYKRVLDADFNKKRRRK